MGYQVHHSVNEMGTCVCTGTCSTHLVVVVGKELHSVDDIVEAQGSNELAGLQVGMHCPHVALKELRARGGEVGRG